MKVIELNICSIKLIIHSLNNKQLMLHLMNIYNLNLISIILIKNSLIISLLNKLIENDCEQSIIKDFNLHHSHWESRKYFIHYMIMNSLLNVIMNVKLKLLLKLNIITCEAYNQHTMKNLIFNSKKLWSMLLKCKVRIDLHQKLNHLLIIMKICLCTFFMQFSTHWLWKKMNIETLSAYLWIYLSMICSMSDKKKINDRVIKITCIL